MVFDTVKEDGVNMPQLLHLFTFPKMFLIF